MSNFIINKFYLSLLLSFLFSATLQSKNIIIFLISDIPEIEQRIDVHSPFDEITLKLLHRDYNFSASKYLFTNYLPPFIDENYSRYDDVYSLLHGYIDSCLLLITMKYAPEPHAFNVCCIQEIKLQQSSSDENLIKTIDSLIVQSRFDLCYDSPYILKKSYDEFFKSRFTFIEWIYYNWNMKTENYVVVKQFLTKKIDDGPKNGYPYLAMGKLYIHLDNTWQKKSRVCREKHENGHVLIKASKMLKKARLFEDSKNEAQKLLNDINDKLRPPKFKIHD